MLEILVDGAIVLVDIIGGTAINFAVGKVAKKRVAKKVKAEDFATAEEYQKALKKATFKANLAATGIAGATSVGLAAGSAYLICDVVPGMLNDSSSSESESTETAESSELI